MKRQGRTRVTKIELDRAQEPREQGARIRAALARATVVHVVPRDPSSRGREFWDAVARYVGERTRLDEDPVTFRRTGGEWLDVRFDSERRHTFRHSKTAQPLHTDGAYDPNAADVVFFFCERQAPTGGETLFLEGAELVEWLEREQPDLLDLLRAHPLTFGKGAGARRRAPAIDACDPPSLCWNVFRVDAGDAEAFAWVERFRRFLDERIVAAGRALELRLAPGEAVFFHDARALHGRRAFEASRRDDRLLWKGGLRLRAEA